MSKHSTREVHVLKVKVWVAILIAVSISAEVGITLAWIVHFYGTHR
jgi:hypothetical protein